MSLSKGLTALLIMILVFSMISLGCSSSDINPLSKTGKVKREKIIVDEDETLKVGDIEIKVVEKSESALEEDVKKATGYGTTVKPKLGSWFIVKINRNNQWDPEEKFKIMDEKFDDVASMDVYHSNLDEGVLIFDVATGTVNKTLYFGYKSGNVDGFIKLNK